MKEALNMTLSTFRQSAMREIRLIEQLPERRYLPELHGVRGLALLGVVVFHLFGNGRISGGIDIFLAISGFLFTGMLLREAASSGGRIDPFRYFGRLVRRIFLPAALVATVTLIVGLLVSPVTQHGQLWAEARASLLYFENFELINSQLAYGAAGPDTSPFQHFWSLSVQGQFYLLWPVIAIAAVLIAKRLHMSAARIMSVVVCLIFIASFLYAVYVGTYNQDEAYLLTTTRAWQIAFGGLLALAGSTIRLPAQVRLPAGWLGIALIVLCGVFLDGAALFPGPWALWPLAGLTLVLIAAGPQGGDEDPVGYATHFLSNPVLAWVADRAYGLYLWHWPLLIFYFEIRDRNAIGIRGAIVILATSLLLASLMYRYIEQPLQKLSSKTSSASAGVLSNKTTVAFGASLLVISGITTSVFSPSLDSPDTSYDGLEQSQYPGAAEYLLSHSVPDLEPFPNLDDVSEFRPDYTRRGCGQKLGQDPGTDEITVCEDEDAPDKPTATIVLAGGSHAGHLEAAFKTLARKHGWEVLVVTKSSCVFGWEEKPDQSMCGQWNQNFIEWLGNNEVDLVVTPGTRLNEPEYVLDAAPKWWSKISQTNTDLMLVRGTPRNSESVPDCLASGRSSQDCGPSKDRIADINPLLNIDLPENVHPIDMTKYVCPQIENDDVENCDAIVGNIIVFYDNHHFTTPFSQSLAAGFEAEMRNVVPHLVR